MEYEYESYHYHQSEEFVPYEETDSSEDEELIDDYPRLGGELCSHRFFWFRDKKDN